MPPGQNNFTFLELRDQKSVFQTEPRRVGHSLRHVSGTKSRHTEYIAGLFQTTRHKRHPERLGKRAAFHNTDVRNQQGKPVKHKVQVSRLLCAGREYISKKGQFLAEPG